jgi:hypothetical protein
VAQALGVHGREAGRDLLEDAPRLGAIERHRLLEILALVPGHDEPQAAAQPAVVLELHDGGMAHAREHAQLAELEVAIGRVVRALEEHLERDDVARDDDVLGAPHLALTARADVRDELVAITDDLAERERALVLLAVVRGHELGRALGLGRRAGPAAHGALVGSCGIVRRELGGPVGFGAIDGHSRRG